MVLEWKIQIQEHSATCVNTDGIGTHPNYALFVYVISIANICQPYCQLPSFLFQDIFLNYKSKCSCRSVFSEKTVFHYYHYKTRTELRK